MCCRIVGTGRWMNRLNAAAMVYSVLLTVL